MAPSESSKRRASNKLPEQGNKKAKPDKIIPSAQPQEAVITTKAKTTKDKPIYEGFPQALIEAGYNQGLITSISNNPIKNQAEFTERVSYLNDDHISKLINLVKRKEDGRIVFTPDKITSILYRSGQKFGDAIDALTQRVDKLKPFLDKDSEGGLGFTVTNISSILSGSAQNVGEAIDALTSPERVVKLKKLLAPVEKGGAGFYSGNISSILNGSAQNVGEAIDGLEIINDANQGRSNPISTEILTKFLSHLQKTKLYNINVSNVESILSELEKTKLRDPSSQASFTGPQSSNGRASRSCE
jgi:hypothetical protein